MNTGQEQGSKEEKKRRRRRRREEEKMNGRDPLHVRVVAGCRAGLRAKMRSD